MKQFILKISIFIKRLAPAGTSVFPAFGFLLLTMQGFSLQAGEITPENRFPDKQTAAYHAQIPKTVIELQQFRNSSSIVIRNKAGVTGKATLINLNPNINTWFLLLLKWDGSVSAQTYHLENPYADVQQLVLDPDFPQGLVILTGNTALPCALWSETPNSELEISSKSGKPYVSLCNGRLLLRNPTEGNKTTIEQVTDLLRNHIWEGEKITVFVRETFFQDAFINMSEILSAKNSHAITRPRPPGAPARPLIGQQYTDKFLIPDELGIALDCETGNRVMVGRWYAAKDIPGVFVSVIQPNLVSESVMESQKKQTNPLDETESSALVYMVAFDIALFDMGFEMGTEHPRVDWSDRVPEKVRDNTLPGPDGIGTIVPLAMTGLVNPLDRDRIVTTFVGGFKRYHGAFRWSDLALKNHGSHYGFIENGTVLSKLQPGLSTILIYQNGEIDLKTWTLADNADLQGIRHARQNGVPIIDYDTVQKIAKVGRLVPIWGQGNWSGSADQRFRTVRAGLGIQDIDDRPFLIYGYFSAATPSAMARIFQAYLCRYAMLLDINALEHTYLAVYKNKEGTLRPQHLVKGMHVLDKNKGDQVLPRFIGYPDNRDFFYLLRKANP